MSNENPIKVKLKPAQSIKTKTNNTYLWDPSFLGLVGETLEKADELVEKTAGLDEQVQAIQEVVDAQVIIINDPTYQAVSQNLPAINTVGSSIGNVNTVAQNISDITGLVADLSTVNTVAGDLTNINTVAGSISSVNTVAGGISNINTVASDISRVGLVADDISSVHTVAIDISTVIDVDNNMSDINACATNMSDINSCASNMTAIQNAPAQATAAANSAQEAQIAAGMAKTNLPLFYSLWSDHKINDVCYLRGDTFSWQSGNVYRRAFEHLADDLLINRPYIIPVNGFSTKFFRNPENDTETQFAWTQGFSILYTDKDYPAAGDPIYYIGSVVDDVDEFAFGSGEYIITSLSADNKYYRETDEDDSVNGYYAWMFNSSTKVYTTSATPAESDDVYTKSGGTYTSAGTVSSVLLGPASSTETIGGYTITYYTAEDGHKIVLADQESTVLNIYNSTGVAWYYIFDEKNIRFKLPRTKHGFVGYRDEVAGYIEQQIKIPNHYHVFSTMGNNQGSFTATNSSTTIDRADTTDIGIGNRDWNGSGSGGGFSKNTRAFTGVIITSVAKEAQSKNGYEYGVYGNSTLVQPRATQMYLYFYVGNFTQTALENTAGLNASLFNNKADTSLNNVSATSGLRRLVEVYNNGADYYKVFEEYDPSDGSYIGKWCEQGGHIAKGSTLATGSSWKQQVSLFIQYKDTDYKIRLDYSFGTDTPDCAGQEASNQGKTTQNFTAYLYNRNSGTIIPNTISFDWKTEGYIQE